MVAAAAAEDRALVRRRLERRFGQHRADAGVIIVAKDGDVGTDAALGRPVATSSISNSSGTKRQCQSSPSCHPSPALFGAVAEPDHPFGANSA